MTHFYERNIVEIKNEYTSFMTSIMSPLMYEGILKIYNKARETEKQFKQAITDNSGMNIENPGVLRIFQFLLKGIKNLSNYKIEAETNRIRQASKCTEWFDDLIRAVIKSYIVLLTYNVSEKQCKIVNKKVHESININSFIHKCYIQCARNFYRYPELFWHGFSSNEVQRNHREYEEIIRESIIEAIKKMLPMKLVLEEYLKNDYIQDEEDVSEHIPSSRYQNIRKFVNNDLNLDNIGQILESDSSDKYDEDNNDNNNNDNIKDNNKDNNKNIVDQIMLPIKLHDHGTHIEQNKQIQNKQINVDNYEDRDISELIKPFYVENSEKQSYQNKPKFKISSPINGKEVEKVNDNDIMQIVEVIKENLNEQNEIFSKKVNHIGGNIPIESKLDNYEITDKEKNDNNVIDKCDKNDNIIYLKSPKQIKGGKNLILKEQTKKYFENLQKEKKDDDSHIEINIKQKKIQ